MTAFNSPTSSFKKLIKTINNWKIIVISYSNNIKINNNWKLLNFTNNLIYLTLKDQISLGYEITKYLKINSYSRKNIGYIYAIQHGAKEIYEIDEDIFITDINDLNIKLNNKNIFYVIRNDSKMINPYNHFEQRNIWPRGFRIKDIGNDYYNNNKFLLMNSNQLKLNPLIYQGLINGFPDVDSIYLQTKILDNKINIIFSNNDPLLYFPGNYIPINSKNTKYLYEIFPFLVLPTTINEEISDIFRGYIIQYFSWRFKGCVIYFSSKMYKINNKLNSQFIKEKQLFYNLDDFIKIINIKDLNNYNNYTEIFFEIIKNLIKSNFLGKNDLNVYKAYLKDLSNIGFNYSNKFRKIKNNYKYYINVYSEFKYYLPQNQIKIIKQKEGNIVKIINHYNILKKYKDILLIINYNHKGFENLNNYLNELYLQYFDNIVFITTRSINSNIFISCKKSHYGFYSYVCFQKVYKKYPNYKGYLFTNDDDLMKIWELNNLDFNIPWLYLFEPLSRRWGHFPKCLKLYNILNNNTNWKINLKNFLGHTYYIPIGIADFYYIPNTIASKISEIFEVMYNSKIFLECAIPTSFGILLKKKYQIIYIYALWGKGRKKVINYLIHDFHQITIHPIKFFNLYFKKKVNQYRIY